MNCLCECNGNKAPALTVDAVVEVDGKILLVKRMKEPFSGYWALPGGFVECGETVEQAVKREVGEETGMKIVVNDVLGIYSRPDRDPRGHVVSVCFTASARGEPEGGDDAREAGLFERGRLAGMKLAFDHNQIIKNYLERVQRW